jgi:branched-chain amino acid transport system substrate-binding protein
VAVLDDGTSEYGRLLADRFAAAAEELRLDVVMRAGWDPQAGSFDRLAGRVASRRPDAVFVGGLLDTQGAEVLEALHTHLGDGPLRLVPDGFTPTPLFAERAGVAAEGAYLSVPGLLPESLRPAGRRFVRRFAPTQPGADVEPSAVYAAESTAVMLDAIARSDGTRASVLQELFATRRRGLLGPIAFDDNGDVRSAPVTILRMRRGARGVEVFEDAALDRVVG